MSGEHWRAGRKVKRTLYVHQGDDETGQLIGLVDTPELAAAVCDAMNGHTEHDRKLRAALVKDIRHYFSAVDDPLYEDVETLCGRILRGEYGALDQPEETS